MISSPLQLTNSDYIGIGTIIAMVGVPFAAGFMHLIVKVERMNEKLNILWGFIVRRANVEVHMAGWSGSKLHPPEEVIEKYRDMTPELRAFYYALKIKLGREPTDIELFAGIEKEFGELLVEKICIPHNVSNGACVIVAMQACKQDL